MTTPHPLEVGLTSRYLKFFICSVYGFLSPIYVPKHHPLPASALSRSLNRSLLPPSITRLPAAMAKQSHYSRRHTTTKGKREVPVKLAFGRPDIGAYLTETFAMKPGAPGAQARRGGTLDMSVSTRATGRAENLSELEVRRYTRAIPRSRRGITFVLKYLRPMRAPQRNKL